LVPGLESAVSDLEFAGLVLAHWCSNSEAVGHIPAFAVEFAVVVARNLAFVVVVAVAAFARILEFVHTTAAALAVVVAACILAVDTAVFVGHSNIPVFVAVAVAVAALALCLI
jgi:hypothetical protein